MRKDVATAAGVLGKEPKNRIAHKNDAVQRHQCIISRSACHLEVPSPREDDAALDRVVGDKGVKRAA